MQSPEGWVGSRDGFCGQYEINLEGRLEGQAGPARVQRGMQREDSLEVVENSKQHDGK